MPRKLPPHCERFHDRHGKLRVYFRRGKGARVALPTAIGTPEFEEAYKAALLGEDTPSTKSKGRVTPGTIGALVASYLRSAAFSGLRATTKEGYRSRIEAIREAHGHRTLAGMTRANIVDKILGPYADRPGQRLAILKMLRVLIRHGIETELLAHDPSHGIKRPKGKEIRSWTDAELARFEARWPVGSRERTAYALMLYTGQRRSDVHRMTWADAAGEVVRVVQQKTGAKLTIPLHRDLRAVLTAAPRDHVTILNTTFGKPFTVDGFSQFMRDAIAGAGLPLDCQPHGLRKAAGRRLAEAGCSAREIMAVLGHRSLGEAERYTRDADQARLAAAAMTRLEGQDENRKSQTSPRSLGKRRKVAGNINNVGLDVALPRGLEPLFSP